MSDSLLRKRLIRLAHSKPELRGDLLPLLKGAGRYETLGTQFRFKIVPNSKGLAYVAEIDGKTYRVILERDHWRLDYLGTLGNIWEAVSPTHYGTPAEAAEDLVRLYKSKKLGPQF